MWFKKNLKLQSRYTHLGKNGQRERETDRKKRLKFWGPQILLSPLLPYVISSLVLRFRIFSPCFLRIDLNYKLLIPSWVLFKTYVCLHDWQTYCLWVKTLWSLEGSCHDSQCKVLVSLHSQLDRREPWTHAPAQLVFLHLYSLGYQPRNGTTLSGCVFSP